MPTSIKAISMNIIGCGFADPKEENSGPNTSVSMDERLNMEERLNNVEASLDRRIREGVPLRTSAQPLKFR